MYISAGGRDIRVDGRAIRIGRLDGDKYKFIDDPEHILIDLRNTPHRIDLFTFMQGMPDTAAKFDYPMEMDNLAVLPISTFEQWWMRDLGFKARNKAKQAERKGVQLRRVPFDDALVHGIWGVYNECPIRQGKPFAHYGKDKETIRREAATFRDSSIFIGAFLDAKLIGFVKLTCDDSRTQAGLMHIVSMIQHRDKSPTNALIAYAVRVCAEERIPHLVYSNFAYGKKLRDSLSDFKERNGFKRVELPRYYVPLTSVGRAAYRLGLHRDATEYCPEPIAARLRILRTAWYNRQCRPLLSGESTQGSAE